MKKLMMILMALVLMMPVADAQNNRMLKKELKKEYKLKMKELEKGKWQLYGSTRSLSVALLQHYEKLSQGEGTYEIMGECSQFKSKNIGHQTCINNAAIIYAQQAGRQLSGRIVSDIASNADDTDSEFDHFYAAYQSLVEKEISGELIESFSVIRQRKGSDTYEMQSFFIVSEEAATRARMRAYENALKESAAAQKYANKVSDFVREGFNPAD